MQKVLNINNISSSLTLSSNMNDVQKQKTDVKSDHGGKGLRFQRKQALQQYVGRENKASRLVKEATLE